MLLRLIRRDYFVVTLVFVQFLMISCQCSANSTRIVFDDPLKVSSDSVIIDLSKYKHCGEYVINDTLNLHHKTLYLPADIKIVIKKGLVKNGCVVGNNTHLKYKDVVFDRVHIKGTWTVPIIKSEMFKDLSYDNALKDVFALASPSARNKIYIGGGDYYLNALNNSDNCIGITSNADVVIDGNIYLRSNGFASYRILYLCGNNISIKGKGCIVGDKMSHSGNTGEWGMGLYIDGGKNISIKGITIKDCWGDCIYITGKCKNVVVDNCLLDNGRRQGISVVSAYNVTIKNCTIQNVEGTKPEYGIDIEPNKDCFVRNVLINEVTIKNCKGGIASYGAAEGAMIDTVIIRSCSIDKTTRCPINLTSTKYVQIESSQINHGPKELALNFENVEKLKLSHITLDGKMIERNNDKNKRVRIYDNVKQYTIK